MTELLLWGNVSHCLLSESEKSLTQAARDCVDRTMGANFSNVYIHGDIEGAATPRNPCLDAVLVYPGMVASPGYAYRHKPSPALSVPGTRKDSSFIGLPLKNEPTNSYTTVVNTAHLANQPSRLCTFAARAFFGWGRVVTNSVITTCKDRRLCQRAGVFQVMFGWKGSRLSVLKQRRTHGKPQQRPGRNRDPTT